MLRSGSRIAPIFFAPDESAGGTGTEFADAGSAMETRLDAALDAAATEQPPEGAPGGTDAPGGPAPGEDAPGEIDPFSDAAIDALVPDDMPFRDGKKLRGQLASYRERYQPFHDALADLDDEKRTATLGAFKALGGSTSKLADTFARLHEGDREYFLDALDDLASRDPVRVQQAAARLQEAANILTGQPAAPAAPDDDDEDEDDDPDRPVTRGDLDTYYAERQQAEQTARAQADAEATQLREITAELSDLGYDLAKAKTDPVEQWRISGLLDVARVHFDGDLKKAAATADAWQQKIIDDFVKAKSADAGRTSSPADAGAAPREEPEPNDTLDSAQDRLESRLAAEFGPDPRSRR